MYGKRDFQILYGKETPLLCDSDVRWLQDGGRLELDPLVFLLVSSLFVSFSTRLSQVNRALLLKKDFTVDKALWSQSSQDFFFFMYGIYEFREISVQHSFLFLNFRCLEIFAIIRNSAFQQFLLWQLLPEKNYIVFMKNCMINIKI